MDALSLLFRWNECVASGQSRPKSAPAFRPRFCFLDKKVLRFYAYFEETAGLDDRAPEKRIRHVHILYHLEDDSISILEPRVQVRVELARKIGSFSFQFVICAVELRPVSRPAFEEASHSKTRTNARRPSLLALDRFASQLHCGVLCQKIPHMLL